MVFALIDVATPTWGPMNEQLSFSYELLNDSYAIGCGTLVFGAFLLIPFALKYGRRPVYIFSTLVQFAMSVWSAKLETVADLMLVNAFSCGVGALSEVIVQMTVADIFFVHQRGAVNTIYAWTSAIGGTLAPVAAGYMITNEGWRWVWWWCGIWFAVCIVLFVFGYEETKYSYPSTLTRISPNTHNDSKAESEKTPNDSKFPLEKTKEAGILTNSASQTC
jgi:MFS family permease